MHYTSSKPKWKCSDSDGYTILTQSSHESPAFSQRPHSIRAMIMTLAGAGALRVHEICIREDAPLAHLNGICDIMDSQADTLAVLRDLRRFHERLSFLFPGERSADHPRAGVGSHSCADLVGRSRFIAKLLYHQAAQLFQADGVVAVDKPRRASPVPCRQCSSLRPSPPACVRPGISPPW